MAPKPKIFPPALRSAVADLPAAAQPDPALADAQFIRDAIRTGKAVPRRPGQPLPAGAEFEIVVDQGRTTLVRHHFSR